MKRKTFTDSQPDEVKPSRTQKKKAAEALQKLGTQLLSLTEAQLDELQLPPEMVEAVADACKMNSHGARRRQIQYIGSLMRHVDATRLEQELDRITLHSQQGRRSFRLAEQWRDELVAGNQDRLAWLTEKFPSIEKDLLMRLIKDAGKSEEERRKAGRAIFRYLRAFSSELDILSMNQSS